MISLNGCSGFVRILKFLCGFGMEIYWVLLNSDFLSIFVVCF